MKSIHEVTAPLYSSITFHAIDPHARPVLVRMREGSPGIVAFFIETDSAPRSPAQLSFRFYALHSLSSYPSVNFRYFSSCLTPDGTQLVHGLYEVVYASAPSRVTQPELPGPPGPPGPTSTPPGTYPSTYPRITYKGGSF